MAMDIMPLLLIVFISSYISVTTCMMDTYTCSWPTNEVVQLRCDFVNCPYLSVEHITVGRLHGNPSSCTELNSNITLRKPIASCNYQLMESHDFFGQVKNNCSRKQVCEISSDEVFRTAGICGREVNQPDSIRNWIHIQHSCYGDIPGVTCKLPTTSSSISRISTTKVIDGKPATTSTGLQTKARRPMTRRPSSQAPATKSARTSGVAFIIPILATLLFCTLSLIVATMLYRHGVCRRRSWKQTVALRLSDRSHNHNQRPESTKLDDLQFKIDSSKLKEFEKRLNKNPVTKSLSNEYFHDFSFSKPSRFPQKDMVDDIKIKTASRKNRRGSLDLPSTGAPLPAIPSTEMYYSDTSESTVATEQDFDSSGRRKRRRVKPLPPLPRPVVSHSEIYFTETETESEAPPRTSRRKETLPKLQPPPKVNRDRSRHDRLRLHNRSASAEGHLGPSNRQSLELALTKGAAKKLNMNSYSSNEHKVKVVCKKPLARPRTPRASTTLYGNIPMSDSIIPPDISSHNNNIAKRSQTLPIDTNSKSGMNQL